MGRLLPLVSLKTKRPVASHCALECASSFAFRLRVGRHPLRAWRLSNRSLALQNFPAMSAFGTKRTCLVALQMSAFEGKADVAFCAAHVR